MATQTKIWRQDIDGLKGFAIISVILYHLGIMKSGYLGVDIFFVINGFLVIPSILRQFTQNTFSYPLFCYRRIIRLFPLILIACIVSLVTGFFLMLPDDYENLAQSSVASIFFSNNILASITTKDYWKITNEYRPLMHTWYLGILMQFYILFPILVKIIHLISCHLKYNFEKVFSYTLIILSILSLTIYLLPTTTSGFFFSGYKFYMLHFRLFEITLGGLIGVMMANHKISNKIPSFIAPTLIFALFVSCFFLPGYSVGSVIVPIGEKSSAISYLPFSGNIMLLLTVALTMVTLISLKPESPFVRTVLCNRALVHAGKMSFSLFILHQILIAFYRYSISDEITPIVLFDYFIVLMMLSVISYNFVERKLSSLLEKHHSFKSFAILCGSAIVILIGAMCIYLHAGVVRDVPELDITVNNVHKNMHAEYVDRVYKYNRDYDPSIPGPRVLIIGNSFARDWGNILLESQYRDKINLSYIFTDIASDLYIPDKYKERIAQSDIVFIFGDKPAIPAIVWENLRKDAKIYGIGSKNFGHSNGVFYAHRWSKDYFNSSIVLDSAYESIHLRWKEHWGESYIDLITPMRTPDGKIRVFSDDHRYISQDCEHLTQAGAQFYASILNFDHYFGF